MEGKTLILGASDWRQAVDIGLQVVTIIVLIFTCIAAFMQAKGSEKIDRGYPTAD